MHQFNMFSLLLGKRVPVNVKHMIKNALGRQNEGEIGTYIGISENISGSKCKFFAFLKDKLHHQINGWSARWLSKRGKKILIKQLLMHSQPML